MPQNKLDPGQLFTREDGSTLEIHVLGDMMPSPIFLRVLDIMRAHIDSKTIVFVVYDARMMLMIRESLPSAYYDRIELYSPKVFAKKEGLRRAG